MGDQRKSYKPNARIIFADLAKILVILTSTLRFTSIQDFGKSFRDSPFPTLHIVVGGFDREASITRD